MPKIIILFLLKFILKLTWLPQTAFTSVPGYVAKFFLLLRSTLSLHRTVFSLQLKPWLPFSYTDTYTSHLAKTTCTRIVAGHIQADGELDLAIDHGSDIPTLLVVIDENRFNIVVAL